MIGILLTGMMILLLSAGLQYAGLQFKDLPTSDQQTWRIIFLYVLSGIFIILSYWQGRKIKVFTRRAWMAEHPAEFSADKVDCYVRFIGRLAQEGASCRLPFSRSECVFYAASVIAEWQTKQKKLGKGMETHRKPIFTEYSSLEMALVGKEGGVHVRANDLRKDWLLLRTKESSQAHCPTEAIAQAASKYTTYQLTERFLLHGDTVVAQGRRL